MESKWESINRELYKHDNYRRMEEVYNFIASRIFRGAKPNARICDIGCGDGSLMERLSKYGEVSGIDISREQLELACRKGFDARYCNVDEEDIPFGNAQFDFVVCTEVIEHVLVPDRILTEAKRILKDDGQFILTTPNLASFGKRLLLLCNRNPFIECSPLEENAVGHLRYFIFPTLKRLVAHHGFCVREFSSDVINFDGGGRVKSRTLARLFPSFGRTLMVVLTKQ